MYVGRSVHVGGVCACGEECVHVGRSVCMWEECVHVGGVCVCGEECACGRSVCMWGGVCACLCMEHIVATVVYQGVATNLVPGSSPAYEANS